MLIILNIIILKYNIKNYNNILVLNVVHVSRCIFLLV